MGLNVRNRVVQANEATAARGLVQQIVSADTARVPDIIRSINTSDRRWTDPELRQIGAEAAENSKEKLHASLALLPVEPGQAEYLYRRLLTADPHELPVIRKALDGASSGAGGETLGSAGDHCASPDERFCAACALAGYVPGEDEERWLSASRFITDRLLALVIKNPSDYAPLLETLRPIRDTTLGCRCPRLSGTSSVPRPSAPSPPTPDRLRQRPASTARGPADGRRPQSVFGILSRRPEPASRDLAAVPGRDRQEAGLQLE